MQSCSTQCSSKTVQIVFDLLDMKYWTGLVFKSMANCTWVITGLIASPCTHKLVGHEFLNKLIFVT